MSVGGFSNWQFAQWFAMLGFFACVVFAMVVYILPESDRILSIPKLLVILSALFTAANIAWYVDDSQPLWEARSRLNESYDILDEVLDVEITETKRYGFISVHNSNRPPTWPPNCMLGRLTGGGGATFAETITVTELEELAQHFENDGFTVRRTESRRESTALATAGVDAIRGDRSYSFDLNLFENDRFLGSRADNVCIEDFERDECDYCVDQSPPPSKGRGGDCSAPRNTSRNAWPCCVKELSSRSASGGIPIRRPRNWFTHTRRHLSAFFAHTRG